MKNLIVIVAIFLAMIVTTAAEVEARCGLFGCRAAGSFQPFNGRFRLRGVASRQRSFTLVRNRSTASGCAECVRHGVGADGFRLK